MHPDQTVTESAFALPCTTDLGYHDFHLHQSGERDAGAMLMLICTHCGMTYFLSQASAALAWKPLYFEVPAA